MNAHGCPHCKHRLKCSQCGDTIESGPPATIWFGFGSRFDMRKMNFCSDDCLARWSHVNLGRVKPE